MTRISAATILLVLASAAPSAAKTVCGQLGDPDGRFYVIEKVKTKPGSHGLVSGYFVTPAGLSTPFSGHYAVYAEDTLLITSSDGVAAGGFGPGTALRNWSAPSSADGGTGQHYGALVDGNSLEVDAITSTSTSFEDCKNVPKFLAPS